MENATPPAPAHDPEILRLHRAEGTSFALRLYPAGPARAPAVLIQPALGMQAGYYQSLAEALRAAGCHAAIAEARGHEETGGRLPGWSYDYGYHELLTEDWPLAMDAVQQRFPAAPLYLLGHSLGGHISSLYAAHHPERLAGLILVTTGSVYWRLWSPWLLVYGCVVALTIRVTGYFPGKYLGFGGREARTLMADWGRLMRRGRFRFGRPPADHDPQLATLTLPVLAITVAGDRLSPRRAMNGLLAKFPRARISRVHLHPNDHGLTDIDHFRWARRPEVVLPAIQDWLQERS